jgi:hypothetical protein
MAIEALGTLETFLSLRGWKQVAHGTQGAMWSDENLRIGVPYGLEQFDAEWPALLDVLAKRLDSTSDALERELDLLWKDEINFRAIEDEEDGTISLEGGADLFVLARTAVRTTATTSVGPKVRIESAYSRHGEAITRQTRFGQTRRGSYVVPVRYTLDRPLARSTDVLPGTEEAPREPMQRRASRTLAQSLAVLESEVVRPAREVRASVIPSLVHVGVTREFSIAIRNLLDTPALSELRTTMRWAPTVPGARSLPDAVALPAEARDQFKQLAKLLQGESREAEEYISGPIVAMRDEGLGFAEISIQTVRRGRQCEVQARLDPDQLEQGHEWFKDRETVIAFGTIGRIPNRGLWLTNLESIGPLVDTRLTE